MFGSGKHGRAPGTVERAGLHHGWVQQAIDVLGKSCLAADQTAAPANTLQTGYATEDGTPSLTLLHLAFSAQCDFGGLGHQRGVLAAEDRLTETDRRFGLQLTESADARI